MEFALLIPLFMMLVLGMFTGGVAYNRKLTITAAAREGARYGATLPLEAPCSTRGAPESTSWLKCVAEVVRQTATGDLDAGVSGREICVAFISGSTSIARRETATTAGAYTTSGANSRCFTDDLGTSKRVQVLVRRTAKLEILVAPPRELQLTAKAVTRVEQ